MTATYRLQLDADFDFAQVEALVPYFARLGISHLYLSPITESAAGSTHGYDVTDHNAVRRELGGRARLDALLDACARHGLAAILDWVPNHAGIGPENSYWQDVLAHGPHSPYARHFDIDWRPLKPELQGKVLLPFLGAPYGEALDSGEIRLSYDDGRFYATYYDNRFSLKPATYHVLLAAALERHERTDAYWDLKDLHEAFASLREDEYEKAEAMRLRLTALEARVEPATWPDLDAERLHGLLEQQWWRLSFWKAASHEINYRRFFDINGLVGLRMEDEQVFWDAHRLLGELLTHEAVAGVRIDHIDGMFDPHGYLQRLQELGAGSVWVEKILAHGETLPDEWPVEGTTGYAFMNDVMRVLVDPAGEPALDRAYRRYVDDAEAFESTVWRSKHLVMETILSSELFRLAYELDRISEADYHTRDFTLEGLRRALMEVVGAFGRYRTYLPRHRGGAREVVTRAVHLARRRTPAVEPSVYDFIARVILGDVRRDLRQEQRAWVGRFQQYTAPVTAKGVEDTAFYRYVRLAALNEVGGEPDIFAVEPHAFHARARFRALRYPRNLVTTATHDHKRGEDTRMRLIALAERAEQWEEVVKHLGEIAAEYRGHHGPSRAQEYLFFQVLVALWSDAERGELPERLWQYMLKAARESKEHTSWINPQEPYEADLEAFVRGMCADARIETVLGGLAREIARLGFLNAVSQLVIKCTTAGVPDFYQGTELFDLSMVDPDNRRPVDFERRSRMREEMTEVIEQPSPEAVRKLLEEDPQRAKFFVMTRLLRLRKERPAVFDGEYRGIETAGGPDARWLAFAREAGEQAVLVLASRFPGAGAPPAESIPLPDALADRRWTDWLSGAAIDAPRAVDASDLPLPWAVLAAE